MGTLAGIRGTLAAALILAVATGMSLGGSAFAGTQTSANGVMQTQSTATYKVELDIESVQMMLTPAQAATATAGEEMVDLPGTSMSMSTGATSSAQPPTTGGTSAGSSQSMPGMSMTTGGTTGTSSMSMPGMSTTTNSAQPPATGGTAAGSSQSMPGMSMTTGGTTGTSSTSASSAPPSTSSSSASSGGTTGSASATNTGAQATATSMGDANANHHVEAHIWDASGAVVSNIVPTITVMNQATGATWTMDQMMGMYDIQVGTSDLHFGNNIHLDDGTYTISVMIGSETATFSNVAVSSGGM